MKKLLVKLALLILKYYIVPLLPLSDTVVEIAKRALVLCTEAEKHPESGEWKRHQVYARLIKNFPSARRRDIALALEVGFRGVK